MSFNSDMKTDVFERNTYDILSTQFHLNQDSNLTDWISFDSLFGNPGKQGIVGLLNFKNNTSDEAGEDSDDNNSKSNNLKCVFKISQYVNYLATHEYVIMKGLEEVATFCPHFCRTIGLQETTMDAKFQKNCTNPFTINTRYPVKKDVLLIEYIDKAAKFYNYIKSSKIDEAILYSSIKQVLMAINIAQKLKQFSHYDLHSFNVMMKRCDKDLVMLYVLDDENQFAIPSFGHYPVIIDYGFSFISDMNNGPLWTSLAHTDAGFMSDRFDWVADPKLFLVSVSSEIKEKRQSKTSEKFRRIVKNMFKPLSIDWDCGWDNKEERGAADFILDIIEPYCEPSPLFREYPHYCIDIIQSLIILPLQNQKYSDIELSFNTFVGEWIKIENEISNAYFGLYVLKNLISFARILRPSYSNEKTRKSAVTSFRRAIYVTLDEISKFARPKNVDYEKMLCSLYVFATSTEGVLYDVINNRMKDKIKEYEKMPVQNVEQIYAAIDVNIPSKYQYNSNTIICLVDCITKKRSYHKLSEEIIDDLNSSSHLTHGCSLYSFING